MIPLKRSLKHLLIVLTRALIFMIRKPEYWGSIGNWKLLSRQNIIQHLIFGKSFNRVLFQHLLHLGTPRSLYQYIGVFYRCLLKPGGRLLACVETFVGMIQLLKIPSYQDHFLPGIFPDEVHDTLVFGETLLTQFGHRA